TASVLPKGVGGSGMTVDVDLGGAMTGVEETEKKKRTSTTRRPAGRMNQPIAGPRPSRRGAGRGARTGWLVPAARRRRWLPTPAMSRSSRIRTSGRIGAKRAPQTAARTKNNRGLAHRRTKKPAPSPLRGGRGGDGRERRKTIRADTARSSSADRSQKGPGAISLPCEAAVASIRKTTTTPTTGSSRRAGERGGQGAGKGSGRRGGRVRARGGGGAAA